jgi:hypothetical protein
MPETSEKDMRTMARWLYEETTKLIPAHPDLPWKKWGDLGCGVQGRYLVAARLLLESPPPVLVRAVARQRAEKVKVPHA